MLMIFSYFSKRHKFFKDFLNGNFDSCFSQSETQEVDALPTTPCLSTLNNLLSDSHSMSLGIQSDQS